jgi:uncharacterized membrane protein YciS (DUF1049 family)
MLFGYFATFNTLMIPLSLGHFYTFTSLPLYLIIGVTLLVGILLAWLISLSTVVSTKVTLSRFKRELHEKKDAIRSMTKQVNELQVENATLKSELKNDPTDDISL